MTLLQRWRQVAIEYRGLKTAAEDYEDLAWALLFTIGTLGSSAMIAAFVGGLNA